MLEVRRKQSRLAATVCGVLSACLLFVREIILSELKLKSTVAHQVETKMVRTQERIPCLSAWGKNMGIVNA